MFPSYLFLTCNNVDSNSNSTQTIDQFDFVDLVALTKAELLALRIPRTKRPLNGTKHPNKNMPHTFVTWEIYQPERSEVKKACAFQHKNHIRHFRYIAVTGLDGTDFAYPNVRSRLVAFDVSYCKISSFKPKPIIQYLMKSL